MVERGRWIEGAAVAKVVVVRCDVVRDATDGECALEDGRATRVRIALVVHGDACPAERLAGVVRSAGGVGTHALCREVFRDDLAPVRSYGGREEGLRVRDDALAGRVGVVVDYARGRVDEVIVWTEVEVKGFAKGGERQSEGVSMVQGG